MDARDFAARLVMSKTNGGANPDDASQALDSLFSDGKGFDVSQLVEKFQNSGVDSANAARSWLGDGANASVSPAQVEAALGRDRIEAFANKLGIDGNTACRKLADILPQIVDTSSQHGELLDTPGGPSGLAGFASKLFKRSA